MRGPKRTIARFRTIERKFLTSKEAYIFLIDSFIQAKPDLLEIDWQNEFASKGRVRRYFARDPKQLFEASTYLAEDSNNYASVSMNWFAITNLNNEEKFSILCRLAAIGRWELERDWSWCVLDGHTRPSISTSDL